MKQKSDHSFQSSSIRAPGVSYDGRGNVIITAMFPEPPRLPRTVAEPLTLYIPLERSSGEAERALCLRQERSEHLCRQREECVRTASEHIQSTLTETRQAYQIIPAAVWVLSKKGKSAALESARFASTFVAIFSVLFIALNYQSFWQILKPHLQPEEEQARSLALQQIVDPLLQRKLQRIPFLTVAGMDMGAIPPVDLPVAPPDTRLIIPKIGKNIPIERPPSDALEREDWMAFDESLQEALRDGIVHYPGTARPGQRGNAFFTGHSSYYPWDDGRYKDVFARLPELAVGDEYVIYDRSIAHHYRVTHVFEVMPDDTSVLDQPPDKQMSTLMTCTPVGTTLRRLIVQGEEFHPLTGELILSDTYADGRLPTGEVLLPI